jgi:hypothetical protein
MVWEHLGWGDLGGYPEGNISSVAISELCRLRSVETTGILAHFTSTPCSGIGGSRASVNNLQEPL